MDRRAPVRGGPLVFYPEFMRNEVAFNSAVWGFKKGSYLREVFEAIEQAVKEGKQVKVW